MAQHKHYSGWSRTFLPLVGGLLAVLVVSGCGPTGQGGRGVRPSVTGQYSFWPMPPADPHMQFLQRVAVREDVDTSGGGLLGGIVFGSEEQQRAAVNKPYGVDMRNGRMYVCDIRAASLVVFDFEKHEMRLVGVSGFNSLANPVDVEVADDDMIYVADTDRGAVFVFDANEKFVKVIGHDDFRPIGVATHGDRLYVCNLDLQIIEIFDRFTGEAIGSIGEVGDEDGQFRVPIGIDTDAEGNVYVVDMMRCRLQKFSPDGDLIAAVGAYGDAVGGFARPKHIAVDTEGNIYVVDAAFQNVQVFNSQFELLMSFGASGAFAGAMNLPAGICVDETSLKYFASELHPGFDGKRLVLVTNQFGLTKVGVYALGERSEGWTIADLSENTADIRSGMGETPAEMRALQSGLEEGEEGAEDAPGGAGGGAGNNADDGDGGL